jgi:hypothetical protein
MQRPPAPSVEAPSEPSPTSPLLSSSPEFRDMNYGSSGPGTTPVPGPDLPPLPTSQRHLWLSDRTWSEFRRVQRVVAKRGLVGSSGRGRGRGRSGGRPPIADATLLELLEAYRWRQRVCARAAIPRKVDESAVRALRVFYAPHPFGWLAPFPAIDQMVVQTFPSYRPPRRLHVVAGFCENGLLRPTWRDGEEWIIDDSTPPPTRVPDYHYLRGNLGCRPLDQEASLAG